jgi:hypothetical protein
LLFYSFWRRIDALPVFIGRGGLKMTTITVDTFWYPENQETVITWIALTLFLFVEADLKGHTSPNIKEVKARLGISDEQLVKYILNWTQAFFHKLRRLTGSSEGVLRELATPTKKAVAPLGSTRLH